LTGAIGLAGAVYAITLLVTGMRPRHLLLARETA